MMGTMAVDVSHVRDVPLFDGMSDDELASVASHFEERHVPADQNMTSEGGGGYFFFVIESGEARVTHDGHVVATFGPGDFFGEAAIFETKRRTATVTATSPVTVLAMFGADFAVLCGKVPELKQRIDTAMTERLGPS
jgi:CRP-like cAMP-binding protein